MFLRNIGTYLASNSASLRISRQWGCTHRNWGPPRWCVGYTTMLGPAPSPSADLRRLSSQTVVRSTKSTTTTAATSGGTTPAPSTTVSVKGPIHDQSCCAKLFWATQVCPFTIKSISTIHDQSCCPTRNVAQHDWSCMGPFRVGTQSMCGWRTLLTEWKREI
jgi:hypothetical protein